jgi:hypothetical protein
MRNGLYILLVCLCGLHACDGHRTYPGLLDRAEALMQEQPDSALVLLQRVHANALQEEGVQARYALLYTQALEKNDLSIPAGDSLINMAVRYYEKARSPHYKALAYLYQGVVYKQMDSLSLAISSYMRAAEVVDRKQNAYVYGLTQSYLAVLYQDQEQYDKALGLYRNALIAFKDAGHLQNVYYSMGRLGDLFHLSNMADSAAYYYAVARKMAAEQRDTVYLYYMDISSVPQLLEQKEYASAKAVLLDAFYKYKGGIIPEECYSDMGHLYLGLQQLDSARYYAQLALQNPAQTVAEYKWNLSLIQEIARQEEGWEKAFGHQMQYMHVKDSVWQIRYQQDIRLIEANYHREKAEYEKENLWYRNLVLSLILISFALLFLVLLFSGIWLFKRWKKHQFLREQVREARHASTQQAMWQSISNKWDVQLFLLPFRRIQDNADEKAFHASILKIADMHYPGFCTWLRHRTPELTDAELCLSCLLFSEIRGKELQRLCHVPRTQTMQTRCYRLYKKLGIQLGKGTSGSFRDVLIALYCETEPLKSHLRTDL